MAHLLKYDSNLGPLDSDVSVEGGVLKVAGSEIRFLSEKDPAAMPWRDLDVDVVLESTGFFTKREGAQKHLDAGAKKVVISAPATDPDITVVLGVNDDQYDRASTTSSRTRHAPRTASRRWRRCSTTPSRSSAAS